MHLVNRVALASDILGNSSEKMSPQALAAAEFRLDDAVLKKLTSKIKYLNNLSQGNV